MIKILRFYFLKRMVKDPTTTAQVYHMMYCGGQPPKKTETVPQVSPSYPEVQSISVKPKTKTRRQEIIDNLNYLKSKPTKTKQDKDSIGVLEAVLKNEPE
jgi:hypothetical protein